jgi:hypothetical protein
MPLRVTHVENVTLVEIRDPKLAASVRALGYALEEIGDQVIKADLIDEMVAATDHIQERATALTGCTARCA